MGYGKLKLDVTYSDSADYMPDELPDIAAHTFTASKHLVLRNLSLTSTQLDIDLSMFTTISYVIVKNTGATYECYVTWASVDAAGAAVTGQDQAVPLGHCCVLPGVTIGNDLTLDCSAGETTTADVIVLGT